MARLTIEQIKAPDLSVASQATARAGEAFQRGISSASDLLSQYQEGLQSQADAELTNLLAGAKNEDEWNAILDSTNFSNMNLSPGMRQQIIDRRNNILGYENQRADTGLVIANTGNVNATAARTRNQIGIDNATNSRANDANSRANDIHGVVMDDHRWRQGARAEDASLAGAALRAAEESMTYGYKNQNVSGLAPENVSGLIGGPGTNFGPRIDGSGLRDPNGGMGSDRQIAYRNGIAKIESDGSGGYEAVGATHETLGRALGRYQIMEANIPQWSKDALGREVSVGEFMSNPSIQDAIFDHRFGEYVKRFGEEGAAQAWFGGTGGVGKLNRTDVHGRLNIGSYGSTFMQNIGGGQPQRFGPTRQRALENPNQGGSAQRRYLDLLANSQFQSTADVLGAYQRQYDYNETGQAAISAEDSRLAEEALAQQILNLAATNSEPSMAILENRRTNPGATFKERLAMEAKIIEATGDGGVLGAAQLRIGLAGASPADIGIANTTLTDMQERQARNPFQLAQNATAEFTKDPAGMLETTMKGLNVSTVRAELEAAINKLANKENISRAEAAYSFARAAEVDIPLLPDLSIGGNNLSENRATDFARKHFKGDAAAKARAALADDRIIAERIQATVEDLGRLERQIQKLSQGKRTIPPELIIQRDKTKIVLNQFYERYGNHSRGTNTPPPAGARLQKAVRNNP